MSNCLLSIGGSGHRSLKPLIFLAAAGALGDEELSLLAVDNDATNGNLTESLDLLRLYSYVRGQQPWLGSGPFFRPKLKLLDERPWSPLLSQDSEPTLDSYLRRDSMSANNADLTSLYDFLYEPDKRSLRVSEGFRGRPSIGAALYRSAAQSGAHQEGAHEQALQRVREELETGTAQGRHVRLFSMGSVFGGTGAAGLPSIPSTLIANMRQGRDHVLSGAAFLLPYFEFNPGALSKDGPHANPDDFIMMMKDALPYYLMNPSRYQCVYAIGADRWRHVPESAVGKARQKNPADLVEFLAALAASHYLTTWTPPAGSPNGHPAALFVLHRGSETAFTWSDVPEHERVKPKLAAFTRFCFLFLSDFEPELQKAARSRLKAAWYSKQIEPAAVNPTTAEFQNEVKALGQFCRAFLGWWLELHREPGLAIDLVHTTAFSHFPFTQEAFATLITGERYALDANQAVRKLASMPFEREPNLTGLGHFVRALASVVA